MTQSLEERLCGPAPSRRILALDGGGVRGLITLGVLAHVEQELERRSGRRDFTLSQYFDLIGGTSTGSIIATGLALGMRVAQLTAIYKMLIPKIFADPRASGILRSRFASKPLADALKEIIGARTLGSAELQCGLAIHAKRLDTSSAWILVNNPRWVYFASNHEFLLTDLVQASAAAPHYFAGVPMKIDKEGTGVEPGYFIDGGVGGNNNPSLEMFMAVRDPAYGFNWPLGADKIYMLSIGTGYVRERKNRHAVFVNQTLDALRGMITDVSLQQVAAMQALAVSGERWFINGEKKDQPSAPYLAAAPSLHYQRMDVRFDRPLKEKDYSLDGVMPDSAEALLERKLKKAEWRDLKSITCAADDNIKLLDSIGWQAGLRYMKVAAPPAAFDAVAPAA